LAKAGRFTAVLAPFLFTACVTAGLTPPAPKSGPLAVGRLRAAPTALEKSLLDDVADRHLDHFSMLDAALIVSGVRDEQELAVMRGRFHALVDPIAAAVVAIADPYARGRKLLVDLFAQGDEAMLRNYDLQATTLLDVLESGRFNCVSATTAYLLAAAEAKLVAVPVLLPSHARAAVVLDSGNVRVETTLPTGFDPDPKLIRMVRQQFVPSQTVGIPLFADETGTPADFLALLGGEG
jgi:hypothetical protein